MQALREALRDLPGAAFADLLESEDAYLLVVDVPGAAPETTEVSVEGGRLQVTARRAEGAPEGFEYRRRERDDALSFELPLPPDATAEGAEATVERGVLELRLPREGSRETTIAIDEA